MYPIQSEADRERATRRAGIAVIFKHSPACGSSLRALREVQAFARAYPEVPVFVVDVIAQRPLSADLAAELGVTHESPQVIVMRGGTATWSAAHFRITSDLLAAAYAMALMRTEPAPTRDTDSASN